MPDDVELLLGSKIFSYSTKWYLTNLIDRLCIDWFDQLEYMRWSFQFRTKCIPFFGDDTLDSYKFVLYLYFSQRALHMDINEYKHVPGTTSARGRTTVESLRRLILTVGRSLVSSSPKFRNNDRRFAIAQQDDRTNEQKRMKENTLECLFIFKLVELKIDRFGLRLNGNGYNHRLATRRYLWRQMEWALSRKP